MNTARSLVRFAVAGLFVNFLAVACVVSENGDDDDDTTSCDPGSFKDCTCADASAGVKKCNASGTGYGACGSCEGGGSGGDGGSGGSGGSSTAGTAGNAGDPGTLGGAGGVSGGAGGEAGGAGASEGGAGGAATDPDAVCFEDPGDDCQECVQVSCCEEWKACANETEGDCEQEFFDIMACADLKRVDHDLTPTEVADCAAEVGGGNGAWSAGLLASTKDLVDCTNGGVDWETRAWDNVASCNSLCFVEAE